MNLSQQLASHVVQANNLRYTLFESLKITHAMHTRLLSINEIMPPRSHKPNLEKALRHDCVIRSDWQYLIDTLEAVLHSTCTARIVIISEYLSIDYEMTDRERWWALDRALAHTYVLRIWQLYDQIKSEGRIQIRTVPFRGIDTVLQEFGVTEYIDQSQHAFTVVPASRQANRIIWEDTSVQRVNWSMQEFDTLWQHPWGMSITDDHLERLMKANEIHPVAVRAAHLDWLTPADIHVLTQLVHAVQQGERKVHIVNSYTALIIRMVYLAQLYIHHQRRRVLVCVPDRYVPDIHVMVTNLQLTPHIHEFIDICGESGMASMRQHMHEYSCVLITDEIANDCAHEYVFATQRSIIVFAMRTHISNAMSLWRIIKCLAYGDDRLLGSPQSPWQQQGAVQRLLTMHLTDDVAHAWEWLRNPLPTSALHPVFARIRTSLRVSEMQTIAHRLALHTQLVPSDRIALSNFFGEYVARYSPITSATITDLVQHNPSHTQYVEFDHGMCLHDINAVIHHLTATLRQKQHCLCWIGEGIDILPIQRACQAIERVRFVYMSDRIISVDGQIIPVVMLCDILQSGETCIVVATPSVRALVWQVIHLIDVTFALAVGQAPLISNRKRMMNGVHRRYHWDATQQRQIETIINDETVNQFAPLELAEITGELVYQIVQ
jgi:hypothetical protein